MLSVKVYLLKPGFQFYDIEKMGSLLKAIASSEGGSIEILSPCEPYRELLKFWQGYFHLVAEEPERSGYFVYAKSDAEKISIGARRVSESINTYVHIHYDQKVASLAEKAGPLIVAVEECNQTLGNFFRDYPNYSDALYQRTIEAVKKDIRLSKELIEYGRSLNIPEINQFNDHVKIQSQLLAALEDPLNDKDSLLQYKEIFSTPLFD
jgi:hypothetical protein